MSANRLPFQWYGFKRGLLNKKQNPRFLLLSLGTFAATLLSTLIFAIPKLAMASGYLQYREAGAAFKSAVISGLRSGPEMGATGVITFRGENERREDVSSEIEKRLSDIGGGPRFSSKSRNKQVKSAVEEAGIQEDVI